MKLSSFGSKFGGDSSIVHLMEDLGNALRENPDTLFMGGGNPASIAEVEQVFQDCMQNVLANIGERKTLFGIYQPPQGDLAFRRELARFLRRHHGWPVTAQNIAIANGSQPAFFVLYNLLAGSMPDGSRTHIHLPLTPEYLGYRDIGIGEGLFTATRPTIELQDHRLFKYHVDFDNLEVNDCTAALCVSRPTNPTGNLLTDAEMAQLDAVARRRGIPLIIDGAYGVPFPGIVFRRAASLWHENIILVLSLSKLGLPGARTGILVASEVIAHTFAKANTIVSLAAGNLGPALGRQLLRHDLILRLSRQHIAPFYQAAMQRTLAWLHESLAGLPYRIHTPEGAIFLWLWFEGLPVGSEELYQRLKQRGVLVVPGDGFFVGIDEDWPHQHQCLRLSYAQDPKVVKAAVNLIGDEVRRCLEGSKISP